jgi:hypothetical protein
VEELAAQVLEQPQPLGGHGQATPAVAGPVQHRPDQRQAGTLAGEPADHLGPAAGLAEGALDEVGVPDPAPMLSREPQVHHERGQVVGDAGDRCGVAGLPLGGECGGPALGGGDRRIAGFGLADVEDRPAGRPSPRPGRAPTPWPRYCGRGAPGTAGAGWLETPGRRRRSAQERRR